MENHVIAERLGRLRSWMEREGIDYYLIPTADYHGSEYVSDYFKVREYFSGFTGSAGTLLVGREDAFLWTDGRYFIQAARELAGSAITLMKQRTEGVPALEAFLGERMQKGQRLGFDGRTLSERTVETIQRALPSAADIALVYDKDAAGELWEERPAFPAGEVSVLPLELAGVSASDKLSRLREAIAKAGADSLFLTKLDDIMWLCNIRGCDVACNPVAMSYCYVSKERAVLFLQDAVVTPNLTAHLRESGIAREDYGRAFAFLGSLSGQKVLLDPGACSYSVCRLVRERAQMIAGENPTQLMKAVKNPVELAHMRKLYLMDSLAVTRFIYWLKHQIGKTPITEVTAAERLEQFRREIPAFFDLSFPTIAGYGANAAMMHYEATPEQCATLEEKGFLLVDSGGQYKGATTDVTRTISLGGLTREQREHYTLVAAGMLQMTNAKFLYGCTGRNLDILARQPLWEKGLDYQCGTGHGVGYILNVHEGPQALRWQYQRSVPEAVLEEGMDVTNEPGVYIEGKHGIRIENVMVVKKAEKNEYGQFMEFETLTYVPLDKAALLTENLSDTQREYLGRYQESVYQALSPYLSKEEKEWLREETQVKKNP